MFPTDSCAWERMGKYDNDTEEVGKKVKDSLFMVIYGQKLPSEESTTTECCVNYQLLALIY